MDRIWIGAIKTNGVSGTVGIGLTCTMGGSTNNKQNVGNGTINGDHGAMPVLLGFVADPDWIDAPIWTSTGRYTAN